MMYTIVPIEHLVGQEEIQAPQEIDYNGLRLQVEPIDAQRVRIVRLISPDPQMFLNPELAPGNILEYGFTMSKFTP